MTIQRLPFDAVFNDESGGNVKTPQSEYQERGAYPVIDQGKAQIGGYVDDRSKLCGQGRSAIIFGDHTRCIKFVDFPFCMGADGVKVLRPKIEADLKYLYYYLRALQLPDAGYDRHFKYLKRTDVLLPSLSDQRRIAAILDQADALRTQRREALSQLDGLTQSIFIEMFGDPATDSQRWQVGTIKEALDRKWLLDIQDGNHGERHPKNADFVSEGIPFVMANCIVDGRLDTKKAYKLSPDWMRRLRIGFGKPNDILLTHKGTVGQVAIVPSECVSIILSPQVTYYRASDQLNVDFLAGYFKTSWFQSILAKEAIQSTRAYIGITRQRDMPMLFPPLAFQQAYADRIQLVDALKATHRAHLAELDALFASLQHRAFAGAL